MEQIEVISDTHLKVILENLSAQDIVKFAYDKWKPSQRSGYTILNLEKGILEGVGVCPNNIAMLDMTHIKLFTIEAFEEAVTPEELFSDEEYELYLDFKEDDPSEYTPDIVSDFCIKNEIDEEKRNIEILAERFEREEMFNYNMWESKILTDYYDVIL
ncbi:MAG: hypothetical protein MJ209_04050 [archaeon]|nr:hypothetical protein [archaeon]